MRTGIRLFIVSAFLLYACENDQKAEHKFVRPDSIAAESLVAACREGDAMSLLLREDTSETAVLYAIRESFPPFTDTLIATGKWKFSSLKFSRTYEIGEDSVIVRYAQKIIHPCYNWQGQAPWKELGVAVYERLDQ